METAPVEDEVLDTHLPHGTLEDPSHQLDHTLLGDTEKRLKLASHSRRGLHSRRRTQNLLQLVGLGLVFVAVRILPVGQTEGPDGQDAVNVVPDP